MENSKEFDHMFLLYYSHTPWWNNAYNAKIIQSLSRKKREQEKAFHLSMECVANGKKIIVFGAGSILVKCLQKLFKINKQKDYFVDNNAMLQGKFIDDIMVCSPNKIQSEKIGTFLLIVLSRNYYDKIKKQLEGYGLLEFRDFIDGRILVEDTERLPLRL